jgi:hypothetical protein
VEFCRQPRMWLSFRVGHSGRRPAPPVPRFPSTPHSTAHSAPVLRFAPAPSPTHSKFRTGFEFLTQFGDDGWYGPFVDPKTQDLDWYIHAKGTDHYLYVSKDEAPVKVRLRSHIVAQVTPKYVAFHWNNYHYCDAQDARRSIACEYWVDVPVAFDTLAQYLSAHWQLPHLQNIIMQNLRVQYGHNLPYKWTHKHVRAESSGVMINARSGMVKEFGITGLEVFTGALAQAALRAMGHKSDDPRLPNVDDAILETLIQHWGTKSYEFSIDSPLKKVFRAHCYFGTRPGENGPDAFPHMLCNTTSYGGSMAAMEFLLPFIGV